MISQIYEQIVSWLLCPVNQVIGVFGMKKSENVTQKIQKMFFTFQDLSAELGVPIATLRIWEKEFNLKTNQTVSGGTKRFHHSEAEKIRMLKYYLIDKEYSFEATHKRLQSEIDEREKQAELASKLQNLKDFLLNLKEML